MSITEQEQHDLDVAATASHEVSSDGSILDHLRARREEIAREETPELLREIPGWKGALAVRFRYPEAGAAPIFRAFDRARDSKDENAVLNANADVLIACCHEVVGRVPGGEWESLDPNHDPTRPVRFNNRLASLLQIDLPSVMPGERERSPGRFIVRNVFSPRAATTGVYDGDVALTLIGGDVITWLRDGSEIADEELVGE